MVEGWIGSLMRRRPERNSNHFFNLNNKWIKISTSRFDVDIEKVFVFWIFITMEESQWHLIKFGECFCQDTLKIFIHKKLKK
jgi:hypothetical protein